ncbi:PRD domain-containing protein [Erysipelothrix sp. HDW6A]|uniref:PRD domain-containing protein n=1 Tax=Erysipelothrix sp. HDW6A TaxID=2714928 RepID=UPI00140B7AEF|nr:PRD domain-containing protein [Erysipelothrix sp. HDW6A]QIK57394.1 PRD domain-containing protein [Erysipelothrix sp. HDW6A]
MTTLAKLLQLFLKNEIISLTKIMSEINLSKRRTQSVMQRLNEVGKGHGFRIDVVKNRGYTLIVTDFDQYSNFIITTEFSSFVLTQQSRVLFEIIILLNEIAVAIPLDVFSDIIGTTIAELVEDLSHARKYLEDCELKLEFNDDAVIIDGSEYDKRNLLVNIKEEFETLLSVRRMLPEYLTHTDRHVIHKILEDSGISLSIDKNKRFISHLDVLILRLFQGNKLEDFYVNMLRMDYRSEEAVLKIRSILEGLYDIKLDKKDVAMLTYLLSEDKL